MDAVEYLKALHRMCVKNRDCPTCPIYKCTGKKCSLPYSNDEALEERVKIVDEWAKACPARTRQSVFLEQYPNAALGSDNILVICPTVIECGKCGEYNGALGCFECKKKYWSQEAKDDDD